MGRKCQVAAQNAKEPIGKVSPLIWQVPKKCSFTQLFEASIHAQAPSDREILKCWYFH